MKKIVLLLAVVLGLGVTSFGQAKKDKAVSEKSEPKVYVKSFLNKKAPELVVATWLTEKPDTVGKFVLFELYGLFCPPCWTAVPILNKLHKQFKKNMVIIGCTRTPGKLPQEPEADYYKGIDREGRTYKALELISVPYALLVDPSGMVRWQGNPNDLTKKIIKDVMKKYKK